LLIALAIASAGHLSCSKTETGTPTPALDGSPLPDASTPDTGDLDAGDTDADVSHPADVSMPDAARDASVDSADDTTDVTSESTDTTGEPIDAPSDLSSDDHLDGIADVIVDRSDGVVTRPDADRCGDGAILPRRAPRILPAGQLECTVNKPCPSSMECIGGGCDDAWHCIQHADGPSEHPCSTEPADFCGCDGVTFTAVLVCPNRPYQRAGACEDGFSCDPTMLRCSTPEPSCPEGQVPTVVDGRYGQCVPIHYCRCQFVWECPHREKYRCDTVATRCTPLPVDP
jgi:hypothetical protein